MSKAKKTNDDKARFLTDTEIWGDARNGNGQLQLMQAYGTKTGMSDLAVLLGSAVSKSNTTTSDSQRSAYVWSASSGGGGVVRYVNVDGDRSHWDPDERLVGARPALPSSAASLIGLSDGSSPEALAKGEAIQGNPIKNTEGTVIWKDVILYGEYPQTIAPKDISQALESAFSAENLTATSKTYTFDSEKYTAFRKPFNAKEHAEYQHKGKKYIRVDAKPCGGGYSTLSNGEQAQAGQSYWVEVQPIEWLRDPNGICVARQAILGGLQFDRKNSYDGNFENTDIYKYLNDIFMKEIQPLKRELGAAPATPPAKEPEGAAGESHLSDPKALATRLSERFGAEIVDEPRFRVNEATAAGLKAVLNVMLKDTEKNHDSRIINPVAVHTAFQRDSKGNFYLSLPMAAAIEAACEADRNKMLEVFNAGKAPSQGRG
jgi:hypothetical protein